MSAGEGSGQNGVDSADDNEVPRNKLLQCRSCFGNWLNRTITKWTETSKTASSIPIVEMTRDRLVSQMKRLQELHNSYVTAIDDDKELDAAESWMEERFNETSCAISEMEESISTLKTKLRQSMPAGNSSQFKEQPSTSFLSANQNSSVVERKSVDAWIDELTEGAVTEDQIPLHSKEDLPQVISRFALDHDLPKVSLPTFDGSPLLWPKFIEQFHVHIHSRPGLTNIRRMDLLQSHVIGEAKQLIEGLGYSGNNYVLCLKELKCAFGHRATIAHAYLNDITSGGVIPQEDPFALRKFYVSVRDCVTTLEQMNYTSELSSSEVLKRTSCRIPYDKASKWNEFAGSVSKTRELSLVDLQKWLKECVDSDFNPYAVARKSSSGSQSSTYSPHQGVTMNTCTVYDDQVRSKRSSPTCSFCIGKHALSRCPEYLERTVDDRYSYVRDNRLCFNCLSASHLIAHCMSSAVCKRRGCGKKHHTSLHRCRDPHIDDLGNVEYENNATTVKQEVFCQVMPVIVRGQNGRCLKTYALLDSGSDVTMIDENLANHLGLEGEPEQLTIKTLTSTQTFHSTKVSFGVNACDNSDSQPLLINKAWTTRRRGFNSSSVRMSELRHYAHLDNLGLQDIEAKHVQILIGADVPEAHLQLDVKKSESGGPVTKQTD